MLKWSSLYMFNYKIRHVNFQIAVLSKTDAGFLKMIKLKEFRVFKNQSLLRAQLENCSALFLPTSLNCHKWECYISWLPLSDCQRVHLANRSSFANWIPPPHPDAPDRTMLGDNKAGSIGMPACDVTIAGRQHCEYYLGLDLPGRVAIYLMSPKETDHNG